MVAAVLNWLFPVPLTPFSSKTTSYPTIPQKHWSSRTMWFGKLRNVYLQLQSGTIHSGVISHLWPHMILSHWTPIRTWTQFTVVDTLLCWSMPLGKPGCINVRIAEVEKRIPDLASLRHTLRTAVSREAFVTITIKQLIWLTYCRTAD